MKPLTSWEIAAMQQTVKDSMTMTCNIYRSTRNTDGFGGIGTAENQVGTNVACYIAPIVGRSQSGGGVIVGAEEYLLSVPVGTDIRNDDRVHISDDDYRVTSVIGGETEDLFIHVNVSVVSGDGN